MPFEATQRETQGIGTDPFNLNADDIDVVDRILYPARPQHKHGLIVNEGYRFYCLGKTGSGKTSLMRVVLYSTIARRLANFALIHDTKGIFPEYPKSTQMRNVEEWKRLGGFSKYPFPVVSFRGDVRNNVTVSAEEVAAYSKELLQQGIMVNGKWEPNPQLCVIEELAAAATAGRKHVKAPSVLWTIEQARKLGGSLIGTTQSPRKIPLDIIGQASSVAYFTMTGADANYLGEVQELDANMVAAIRGPNGEGLPKFQYVLWDEGKPWDGKIHQLDKKSALMFE